ncbi:Vmc-like lipoprotein signal peptide domain-containing protein [Microcoleus sp. FACHB-1515]|uniref:Vmc-like lipoprotein signal peptide domain-containing protein n=1 Tax=Microcoleus sp. FACHB-1515 TaxID=2692821 RepID=UPI0037CB528B
MRRSRLTWFLAFLSSCGLVALIATTASSCTKQRLYDRTASHVRIGGKRNGEFQSVWWQFLASNQITSFVKYERSNIVRCFNPNHTSLNLAVSKIASLRP